MVGGDAADFAEAKPVLDAVGRTVVHVGPNGSGQTVKAANQLIVAVNIEVLAEAVVFLRGLRRRHRGGAGRARRRPRRVARCWTRRRRTCSGARSSRASGSTCTTRTWASSPPPRGEAGVVMPLGAVAAQLMASARANGDGGLDHSALLRGVERLSGRTTS